MAQSYLFLLAFVLAVALAATVPPSADSKIRSSQLILGGRLLGDTLVLQESVVRSSKSLRNRNLEQTFFTPKNHTITQVRVLNHKKSGKEGNVSVLYGGPGWWFVTLNFENQKSHGIHSVVELYARP